MPPLSLQRHQLLRHRQSLLLRLSRLQSPQQSQWLLSLLLQRNQQRQSLLQSQLSAKL